MTELDQNQYDIIVVGAGMVGLTGALACVSEGSSEALKIAVIESQSTPPQWRPDKFDNRVSALTEASRQILSHLGAWDEIEQTRISPYQNMHVWDADGVGKVNFCAADIQQPVLGHIVENNLIVSALTHQAQQHPQIELLYGSGVAELSPFKNNIRTLELESGQLLSASLVIAADGALSTVRTLAEIELKEKPYHHNAIVTTVKTEKEHGLTAWQRFDETGPLAFLPLSKEQEGSNQRDNHYSSIVWSVTPEKSAELMALDEAQFRLALGAAIEFRIGEVLEAEPRFHFPLIQRHAQQYVLPGLALIGDAAHTIHPLAGQGVNLGFLDAAVLAEELQRAIAAEVCPGNLDILKRYQRRRRGNNRMMIYSMMGFKKLFEQPALPVRWARNRGMDLFDKTSWLKNPIASYAMRVNSNLPKIARG
ncbi:MAG: UbiH/UbiF/VisC/COQ6 family ubiquinone biosynthesis hydroxylase [Pseudomonadales bacterium]|nr:UbiH/UbiF/VisC/COQ6 family ubiquinone biosynthesis hydroxylase [Pseudomonadales bacterium]